MKNFGLIKNNLPLIFIVSVIYFLYISIFIKPWNFKYFSLVDDGQVVIQSSNYFEDCIYHLKCSKFVDQTFEFGTSRLRPSYWLINNINYELFGKNPVLHHIYRAYIVGYIGVLLLTLFLLNFGLAWPLVIIFSTFYYTTYSFSENIIRLGTNEPYQVLFLGIFSILYLTRQKVENLNRWYLFFLVVILVWTLAIKENNIAILPAIFLTEFVIKRANILKNSFIYLLTIPSVIIVVLILTKRFLPSTISFDIPNYVSNYVTSPFDILSNIIATTNLLFNTLSPFLKLGLLLTPLMLISEENRKIILNKDAIYWFFCSIFFIGILFPWKYVLDRYQLVGIFCLTLLLGVIFDRLYVFIRNNLLHLGKGDKLLLTSFNILVFIVLANLYSRGLPFNLAKTINYSNWFSVFTHFESDQINGIAKYNADGVSINGINNLNDWELLYELPVHLSYLYDLKPNIQLFDGKFTDNKYLFSRSSFDSYLKLDDITNIKFPLVVSKSYDIPQINIDGFRSRFFMKPVETIIDPPLQSKGYEYYWEIRQIKKI